MICTCYKRTREADLLMCLVDPAALEVPTCRSKETNARALRMHEGKVHLRN
jgi:hypothetical protein